MLQFGLAGIVSLPLFYAFANPELLIPALVAVATILWAIGFYFEAMGDWQLVKFKRNPENKGKLLNTGLWALTRHPNYFGDGVVWWSFFLFALASGGWYTFVGSVVMTVFLRKVSGVDLLEKKLKNSKPGYKEYVESTPAFIPRLWPKS